ncbi:MAG TPA: hypothetical protein VHB74_09495 [Devosia sp.]|nr:hypothetical protein [Devosia sp.]
MDEARLERILTAIALELNRQGVTADAEALAHAVEAAIDAPPPRDEGRTPDELNASNDE